ncbi:MAG TPA: hypothetical protein DCX14_06485 [Flavobacteriales bacterium]|nr:hypothetical protein [Flavobacteriales bacterium]
MVNVISGRMVFSEPLSYICRSQKKVCPYSSLKKVLYLSLEKFNMYESQMLKNVNSPSEPLASENVEMSRYIDLEAYHSVERMHPYYIEMTDVLVSWLARIAEEKDVSIWEFGSGTGLSTESLLQVQNVNVHASDIDINCCNTLEAYIGTHVGERLKISCADATEFQSDEKFDAAISVFAHDHITYTDGVKLAKNIHRNLKKGSLYLLGGELLPFFDSAEENQHQFYEYHMFIIEKALREGHFELAKLEIDALRSGVQRIGDFKRHEVLLEEEMAAGGFKLKEKVKLGPDVPSDVGGVFAYAFESI